MSLLPQVLTQVVPMCYIAKLFGRKVICIETFTNSKTRKKSVKMVYPIADIFIVQWEYMLEVYQNGESGYILAAYKVEDLEDVLSKAFEFKPQEYESNTTRMIELVRKFIDH